MRRLLNGFAAIVFPRAGSSRLRRIRRWLSGPFPT
jgi:hypothetical protein